MRRATSRLFGSALLLAASCHTTPKAALPSDLPPPEYETPRGYDLGGPKKDATSTPTAAPAPSATAPAVAAPPSAPATPPALPAPPPKG